jgi:heme/copper-type cytochrome/quinol oxidase subunit 2
LVSPAASPSGQLSFTPSEPAPGRTVVVTVTGRTVSPAPATVDVRAGAPVRLTVTSDATNQLHVHGLDLEKPLVAGQPLTLDLSFPDPGVYEVETHEPSLLLLRFAVR